MSDDVVEADTQASVDFALANRRMDALFTRDAKGDLLTLNELEPLPPPTPAPRVYLGVTAGGIVRAYRHDVPAELRVAIDRLSSVAAELAPPQEDLLPRMREVLMHHDPDVKWEMSAGPAFVFPKTVGISDSVIIESGQEALIEADFPYTATWLRERWPCYGVVIDDRAVSICYSARRIADVAEAGVDTAEGFRGRGYAALVTAAWAIAIRAAGITPVYSTDDLNHASRAVARKLGLRQFCRDVQVA